MTTQKITNICLANVGFLSHSFKMNWQLLYVAAAPQLEIISIFFFGKSSQWIVLFYARKRTLVYTQKWISSWLIRKSIELWSATSQPWLLSTTVTEKLKFIVKVNISSLKIYLWKQNIDHAWSIWGSYMYTM